MGNWSGERLYRVTCIDAAKLHRKAHEPYQGGVPREPPLSDRAGEARGRARESKARRLHEHARDLSWPRCERVAREGDHLEVGLVRQGAQTRVRPDERAAAARRRIIEAQVDGASLGAEDVARQRGEKLRGLDGAVGATERASVRADGRELARPSRKAQHAQRVRSRQADSSLPHNDHPHTDGSGALWHDSSVGVSAGCPHETLSCAHPSELGRHFRFRAARSRYQSLGALTPRTASTTSGAG